MGLNIGITVKKQEEGYYSEGSNPKGTHREIEERFRSHMLASVPALDGTTSLSITEAKDAYDFDVRPSHYGDAFGKAGGEWDEVYLAIFRFILDEFSGAYGIDMRTYHSP